MVVEYIASRLTLLPHFEVDSIERESLVGFFSKPVPDDIFPSNLFLPDLRWFEGTALKMERGTTRTVEVSPSSWSDIRPDEVLNRRLAYCGNYDRRCVNLVVNPEISWARIQFVARKAVQSLIVGTDCKSYRKFAPYNHGDSLAEGEALVDAGWNHEHCLFCSRRIGLGDVGYRSDHEDFGDEWACGWCFHHAVQVHDLRPLFIPFSERF